jgi:tRNA (guanine37-N1)-methyltransferase
MSPDLRVELRHLIPEDMLNMVPRSFDIIGSKSRSVAIIEIPETLEGYAEVIAKAVMRVHKNVSSVLSRESERTGEYRTRELRLIAGDPDTEVLHREYGCVFRLDPRTVYFSPREGNERERVARAVDEGENVLVMFSGVGPLPIRIAKTKRSTRATAIELNPYAHNYCVENIHLNGVADRVEAIHGDVRDICPRLGKLYDRVLMPLPRGAYKFLDVAVPMLVECGTLQFYHWAGEEDLFTEARWLVEEALHEYGRRGEFTDQVRVSQYSPRVWKIRLDVRVFYD